MQLAERLGLVARAQRLVDDALADVEPELLRHQLRVMVAQGLIGASGFTLAQLPTELPPEATEALRERFAEADRANWALIEQLRVLSAE